MGAMNVIEAHACVKTKQVDLAKQQAMKGWPSSNQFTDKTSSVAELSPPARKCD